MTARPSAMPGAWASTGTAATACTGTAAGGPVCALLARIPDLNQSLVIIALADDFERRTGLAASMLDLITARPSG